MIDPKLFTVERLLALLFDDRHGNVSAWRKQAGIIVGYMPPYPSKDTRPSCVVAMPHFEGDGSSFLRHSAGPRQGHFWDCYGDDYLTPELALLALLEAPIPPWMVKRRLEECPYCGPKCTEKHLREKACTCYSTTNYTSPPRCPVHV